MVLRKSSTRRSKTLGKRKRTKVVRRKRKSRKTKKRKIKRKKRMRMRGGSSKNVRFKVDKERINIENLPNDAAVGMINVK